MVKSRLCGCLLSACHETRQRTAGPVLTTQACRVATLPRRVCEKTGNRLVEPVRCRLRFAAALASRFCCALLSGGDEAVSASPSSSFVCSSRPLFRRCMVEQFVSIVDLLICNLIDGVHLCLCIAATTTTISTPLLLLLLLSLLLLPLCLCNNSCKLSSSSIPSHANQVQTNNKTANKVCEGK